MNKLINDHLLIQYTAGNNHRPAMSVVQNLDGVLYATESRILARINAEKCFKKYEFQESYPNAKSVIDSHKEIDRAMFKTSDLLDELMKVQMLFVSNTEDCEKCDGDGMIKCPCCGNDADCEECDGTGEIPTELLRANNKTSVHFFNRTYKTNYLELIFRTAHFTGVEDIEVINGADSSIFKVGDFEILLMCYLTND